MRPRLIKRLLLFCGVASVAFLLSAAPALANLEVNPSENFGDVEVGSSATAIITATNIDTSPIYIDSIVLVPTGDFALLVSPEGAELQPWESVDIVVNFAPTVVGLASATLVVDWCNSGSGTATVALEGVGVSASPPPTSIEDVLAHFDASVADGTLVGYGSGNSADGRLGALRNMIVAAGAYLDQGEVALAIAQLEAVLARCDGDSPPRDFVQGVAAGELHDMVETLIAELEG